MVKYEPTFSIVSSVSSIDMQIEVLINFCYNGPSRADVDEVWDIQDTIQ